MRRALIALAALSLAGCSSMPGSDQFAGGGGYTLERTPDGGCKITVSSTSDAKGISVAVDGETCSVAADLDSLDAVQVPLSALIEILK